MKKIVSLLLSFVLVFSFTACVYAEEPPEAAKNQEASETAAMEAEAGESTAQTDEAGQTNILVAYFSHGRTMPSWRRMWMRWHLPA